MSNVTPSVVGPGGKVRLPGPTSIDLVSACITLNTPGQSVTFTFDNALLAQSQVNRHPLPADAFDVVVNGPDVTVTRKEPTP